MGVCRRVVLGVAFGAVAGVLGVEGAAGFAVWVVSFAVASGLMVVKAGRTEVPRKLTDGSPIGGSGIGAFFVSPWDHLIALSQSFLTFVLFWTYVLCVCVCVCGWVWWVCVWMG